MHQYDALRNPTVARRGAVPYVVVLQSHLLTGMATITVAPILRTQPPQTHPRLTIQVMVMEEEVTLFLPEMGAVDARRLSEYVGSLDDQNDRIRPAIDFLFNGF